MASASLIVGYGYWAVTMENIIVDDYDRDFVIPSFIDVPTTVPDNFRCSDNV